MTCYFKETDMTNISSSYGWKFSSDTLENATTYASYSTVVGAFSCDQFLGETDNEEITIDDVKHIEHKAKKCLSSRIKSKSLLEKSHKSVPDLSNFSLVQQHTTIHADFPHSPNSITMENVRAEPYKKIVDDSPYSKITRSELLCYQALTFDKVPPGVVVKKRRKGFPTLCTKNTSTTWFKGDSVKKKLQVCDRDIDTEIPLSNTIKQRIRRMFGTKCTRKHTLEKSEELNVNSMGCYELPQSFYDYLLPNNCGYECGPVKSNKAENSYKAISPVETKSPKSLRNYGKKNNNNNFNVKKVIFLHKAVQTNPRKDVSPDVSPAVSTVSNESSSNLKDEYSLNHEIEIDDLEFYEFLVKLNDENDDENTLTSKKISLLNLLIHDEEKRLQNALHFLKMRQNTVQTFLKSPCTCSLSKKVFGLKNQETTVKEKLQNEYADMQRIKMKFIELSLKRRNALIEAKRKFDMRNAAKKLVDYTDTLKIECDAMDGDDHVKTVERSNSPIVVRGEDPQVYVNCDGTYLNFLFEEAHLPQIFSTDKTYVVNREALDRIKIKTLSQHIVTSEIPIKRMEGPYNGNMNSFLQDKLNSDSLPRKSVADLCSLMFSVPSEKNITEKNTIEKNLDTPTVKETKEGSSMAQASTLSRQVYSDEIINKALNRISVQISEQIFMESELNSLELPKQSLQFEVKPTMPQTQFLSKCPSDISRTTLTQPKGFSSSTTLNTEETETFSHTDQPQVVLTKGNEENMNQYCGDCCPEMPCSALLCLLSSKSKEFKSSMLKNKSNILLKLSVSPNLVVKKASKALEELLNDLPKSGYQSRNELSQWHTEVSEPMNEDHSCVLQDFETIFQKVLSQTIEEYRRTVKED